MDLELNLRIEVKRMYKLNELTKNQSIGRSNVFIIFLFLLQLFINCMLFNHILFIVLDYVIILTIAGSNKFLRDLSIYLKMGIFFGIFVLIFNIILNPNGETKLVETTFQLPLYGNLTITLETVINSAISILSLISLIMVFGLMNKLINPDGLTKIFAKMRLPYSITFMIITSIRFFPLLIQDLKSITEVQKSRGFELEGRNFLVKIKNQIVIILPLLTNSLDRSIQMAEALEARGFGMNKKRTMHNPIKFRKTSYLSIIITIISVGFSIAIFVLGIATFDPYPKFNGFGLHLNSLIIFIIHLTLHLLNYYVIYMEGKLK
ncbi:MAG: hypothetical protein GF364_12375 [Candidatus Lokiarchaeota archaeon]|nr:hypothetical protein [Candidatus Lokiarchaeota archaeon]